MIKKFDSYIKEGVEIDKPFATYPIPIMSIYFQHNKELVSKLKEYYDRFLGRKVTFEGSYYKEVEGKRKYGTFTIIVKKIEYKSMGAEPPLLYFSDSVGPLRVDYKVSKILSSVSMKKGNLTIEDPYGEEDWEDVL